MTGGEIPLVWRIAEFSPRSRPVYNHYLCFFSRAGVQVEDGFSYTSDNNDEWLSVDDLRAMLSDLNL